MFFIIIFSSFVSDIRFNYKFTEIAWAIMPMCIFLMYFPIRTFLVNYKDGFDKLSMFIEVITIIAGIIILTQKIFWDNYTRELFLAVDVTRYYRFHEEQTLRLYGYCDGVFRIALPVAWYRIVRNEFKWKKNIINYLCVIVSLLDIMFVDQSRIYLLAEIVSIIFIYVTYYKEKNSVSKKKILIFVFFAFVFIFIMKNNVISILNTLIDGSSGSVYARMGAIGYYFSNISDWILTGYGRVIPEKGTDTSYVIRGANLQYNIDDIGLLGLCVSMGIMAGIWYIIITCSFFKRSKRKNRFRPLVIGLAILNMISIFTQSYLDNVRIICMMFTMAIIDFSNNFENTD